MTKKKSPPPTLQTEPYRVYDLAVMGFFSDLNVVGEGGKLEAVTVTFATPKREFSTQDKARPNYTEPVTAQSPKTDRRAARTVPYPAVSVMRLSPVFDGSRYTPLLIRKLRLMDRNRSWVNTRFPLPYDIQYQVDILAKYRVHMNQLVNEVQLKFPDLNWPIPVVWGEPFEDQKVYLHLGQILDNSLLEAEDEHGDTIMRSTITVTVKGWLLQKLTSTPTVLHLFADVYAIPEAADWIAPDRDPDFSVELQSE